MYYCKTHDKKRESDCYSCWDLLKEEKDTLLNACKLLDVELKKVLETDYTIPENVNRLAETIRTGREAIKLSEEEI